MLRNDITFSTERTFFTSDTHFCHSKVIEYSQRPFASAEEMNEKLIQNWNRVVPKNGVVFHLGDFCFGESKDWNAMLDRLNGSIYLVLGNHDLRNVNRQFMSRFTAVDYEMLVKVGDRLLILNHYPLLTYGGQKSWGWQLFGHIHTNQFNNKILNSERMSLLQTTQYDVGVDNNNYTPVSFERDCADYRFSERGGVAFSKLGG